MRVLVVLGSVPSSGELVAAVAVRAQNPQPPPGKGEEFGKASPIALVVIILLGLATVVLIRSMTKRIRRLPASFDTEPERDAADERSADPDADPDARPGRGSRG